MLSAKSDLKKPEVLKLDDGDNGPSHCAVCNRNIKKSTPANRTKHLNRCIDLIFDHKNRKAVHVKIFNNLESITKCPFCKDIWTIQDSKFKMNHMQNCGNYHNMTISTIFDFIKDPNCSSNPIIVNHIVNTDFPRTPLIDHTVNQNIHKQDVSTKANAFELLMKPKKQKPTTIINTEQVQDYIQSRTKSVLVRSRVVEKRCAAGDGGPICKKSVKITHVGDDSMKQPTSSSLWDIGSGTTQIPSDLGLAACVNASTEVSKPLESGKQNQDSALAALKLAYPADQMDSELSNEKHEDSQEDLNDPIEETDELPKIPPLTYSIDPNEIVEEIEIDSENHQDPVQIHSNSTEVHVLSISTPSIKGVTKSIYVRYQNIIDKERENTYRNIEKLKADFKSWVSSINKAKEQEKRCSAEVAVIQSKEWIDTPGMFAKAALKSHSKQRAHGKMDNNRFQIESDLFRTPSMVRFSVPVNQNTDSKCAKTPNIATVNNFTTPNDRHDVYDYMPTQSDRFIHDYNVTPIVDITQPDTTPAYLETDHVQTPSKVSLAYNYLDASDTEAPFDSPNKKRTLGFSTVSICEFIPMDRELSFTQMASTTIEPLSRELGIINVALVDIPAFKPILSLCNGNPVDIPSSVASLEISVTSSVDLVPVPQELQSSEITSIEIIPRALQLEISAMHQIEFLPMSDLKNSQSSRLVDVHVPAQKGCKIQSSFCQIEAESENEQAFEEDMELMQNLEWDDPVTPLKSGKTKDSFIDLLSPIICHEESPQVIDLRKRQERIAQVIGSTQYPNETMDETMDDIFTNSPRSGSFLLDDRIDTSYIDQSTQQPQDHSLIMGVSVENDFVQSTQRKFDEISDALKVTSKLGRSITHQYTKFDNSLVLKEVEINNNAKTPSKLSAQINYGSQAQGVTDDAEKSQELAHDCTIDLDSQSVGMGDGMLVYSPPIQKLDHDWHNNDSEDDDDALSLLESEECLLGTQVSAVQKKGCFKKCIAASQNLHKNLAYW